MPMLAVRIVTAVGAAEVCVAVIADTPPAVPASLAPPKGHVPAFELRAEGVQIYECKPAKAGGFEWVLKAPDAVLFDDRGDKSGTHFAGPTWQANDGSKIVAEKVADAPGRRSIPWLLLRVKSHAGDGAFAKVTYIQRVDTWAGQAPTAAPTTPWRNSPGSTATAPHANMCS